MEKSPCTLCDQLIIGNDLFRMLHIFKDLTYMFLFIIKLFTWMLWQSFFKLGTIKNFPCKCGHKAFWHLVMVESHALEVKKINWFNLIFYYRFKQDKNNLLGDCLRCNFKFNSTFPETNFCFEFEPINNLIYLENLYKKRK